MSPIAIRSTPVQDAACSFHYGPRGEPPAPGPGLGLVLPGHPCVPQFTFTFCPPCLHQLREAIGMGAVAAREDGFYWVLHNGSWIVCRWVNRAPLGDPKWLYPGWQLLGGDDVYRDGAWQAIGPRIEPPPR